jgi:hypothetical protein
MKTLKQSLARLEKYPPIAVPSGLDFQTYPNSLIDLIRILNLPEPDFNGWKEQCVYSFSENKAQGMVFAHDDVWFLSSKDTIFRLSVEGSDLYQPTGVHRLAEKPRVDLVGEADLDRDDYVHIGGLGYLDGLVFVPIESKDHDADWLLLGIDEELCVVGHSRMPHEMKDAFVSVNPWNKRLYVCSREKTNRLYAYNVSKFLDKLKAGEHGANVDPSPDEGSDILLFKDGSPDLIQHIPQGVSFSEDGYIFLSWWLCATKVEDIVDMSPWHWLDPAWWAIVALTDVEEQCVEFANHIRVYNALTGVFLYETACDFEGTVIPEIEGLSVHPSGVLYVAVSDHVAPDQGEFKIHAFQ